MRIYWWLRAALFPYPGSARPVQVEGWIERCYWLPCRFGRKRNWWGADSVINFLISDSAFKWPKSARPFSSAASVVMDSYNRTRTAFLIVQSESSWKVGNLFVKKWSHNAIAGRVKGQQREEYSTIVDVLQQKAELSETTHPVLLTGIVARWVVVIVGE